MNDQEFVALENESDEFEQVASLVRSDEQNLRRIAVGVEVGEGEQVSVACEIWVRVIACLRADRWINTALM